MRKNVWGLRSIIIVLIVAQVVLAVGIGAAWLDARRQVRETRILFDDRVRSETAQTEEIMNLFHTNLKTMRLIKKRQDEQHALLNELLNRPDPVFKPPVQAPNRPRTGRPN